MCYGNHSNTLPWYDNEKGDRNTHNQGILIVKQSSVHHCLDVFLSFRVLQYQPGTCSCSPPTGAIETKRNFHNQRYLTLYSLNSVIVYLASLASSIFTHTTLTLLLISLSLSLSPYRIAGWTVIWKRINFLMVSLDSVVGGTSAQGGGLPSWRCTSLLPWWLGCLIWSPLTPPYPHLWVAIPDEKDTYLSKFDY